MSQLGSGVALCGRRAHSTRRPHPLCVVIAMFRELRN